MSAEMSLFLHVLEENEDFEIHDVGHFEDGLHEDLEDGRLEGHHLGIQIQRAQWRKRVWNRATNTHGGRQTAIGNCTP